MTTKRKTAIVVTAVALVFAVIGGWTIWFRRNYHEWPFANLPERLEHCHRVYGQGDFYTAPKAPQGLRRAYEFAPPLSPHHGVYAEPGKTFTNDEGEKCPGGLWVKDGDGYVAYSLFGGP
jgi:hypothetical protein